MRRYYAHYVYIYPHFRSKHSIVELDESNRIVNVLPFEKEIANTEFYSGLLVFAPNGFYTAHLLAELNEQKSEDVWTSTEYATDMQNCIYSVYDENGLCIPSEI